MSLVSPTLDSLSDSQSCKLICYGSRTGPVYLYQTPSPSIKSLCLTFSCPFRQEPTLCPLRLPHPVWTRTQPFTDGPTEVFCQLKNGFIYVVERIQRESGPNPVLKGIRLLLLTCVSSPNDTLDKKNVYTSDAHGLLCTVVNTE